ncbi:P-type conjugative transfer protein TrbJ [Caulobacter segnis]|uniref:P-type conjugative transfer protein TrbJ n=1 Tax=Caulobacter segnis TaxID=88688 RepID=UPI00240EE610|nr:P-type conjugative transfer protein TrbJ [Caulobacter segnis]MDG2522894.1 P-type conjugative transfer protein TrbJ [Caulobacter segnis]
MLRRRFLLAGLLGLAAGAAHAQIAVHDPANYAQNLLQAARSLETINKQIQSLQNEARNLAAQPYSSLQRLKGQVDRTRTLLSQTRRIALDVRAVDLAFERGAYGAPAGDDAALVERARSRWADQVGALQDSLRVQAQAFEGVGMTGDEALALVTASQDAQGALSATQAGNQLLALQARQLADLTAVISAQARAEALAEADRAAAKEESRLRFERFMNREKRK